MSPLTSRPSRSTSPVVTALALLTGLTVALLPAPAQAANRVDVKPDSTIVVDGKGYGHGKGLSQYGAQGAARQGLSYREIVEFYYPGTSWGSVRGQVKVKISRNTSSDLVVRSRDRLRVRSVAGKQTWMLPDNGARLWRLTTNRKNRTVVQFKRDSARWERWKAFKGVGQFGAAGRPITLVTATGDVAYRGRLRAAAPTRGNRARETVNLVSMENYLRGVVPLEMPASWHPEAVRSQAIAARTYATYERSHPLARHYQICDTTQCQVYGGASAEHPLSDAAIKATARQILTHEGEPAFTQFSSSNGGWAAAGSMPYQVAKHDPYDGWDGNPVHDWQIKFTRKQIQDVWPQVGTLRRISVTSRTGHGKYGGRVLAVTLVGSNRSLELTGDDVRSGLGLRSNWFDLSVVTSKRRTVRNNVR